MTDDQEVSLISTLRLWAWTSFDRRRDFEAKINIGIWTALSALIGILLSKEHGGTWPPAVKWTAGASVSALMVLHGFYLDRLEKAQSIDRSCAHHYDELLEARLPNQPYLKETRAKRSGRSHFWGNYSLFFEFAITALLCGCLIAVIISK